MVLNRADRTAELSEGNPPMFPACPAARRFATRRARPEGPPHGTHSGASTTKRRRRARRHREKQRQAPVGTEKTAEGSCVAGAADQTGPSDPEER